SVDNVYIQSTKATAKDWLISFGLFVLSVVLVGIVYYFKPYIDQNFSMEGVELGWYHLDWMNYTDIVTTAIFLVGMWLMAKRRVENWLFWILGDFISVPMYLYKGLGITSVQYFIFTILAIIGYIKWKKNISVENA
ncbi:nicotinamide mononucleotide transporter, partial [Escherichia coli]|nr:nicotinamide mononucleotide transporter [Escherichia coli]